MTAAVSDGNKITFDHTELLDMFHNLGYSSYGWSDQKLESKLKQLPALVRESDRVQTNMETMAEEQREYLQTVLSAIENDATIEVQKVVSKREPKREGTMNATKEKKVKAPKVEKVEKPAKGKPAKAAKAAPVEDDDDDAGSGKDAFGSRLGTTAAAINAIITEEPQTEPEIRTKVNSKYSVEWHLDKMVRLGHLKWKKGAGYYLAKSK